MSLIGNIIWLVCGGFWMGLGWWIAGVLMAISIVGLPWARACFTYGSFCFAPFGREAVRRPGLHGKKDDGAGGPIGTVLNVIWLIILGFWLAIGHVFAAVISASTIIGIPFAIQHIKLAECALMPRTKIIVAKR